MRFVPIRPCIELQQYKASFFLLSIYLKYKILSLGKEGIEQIYDVNEGLENRIYEWNDSKGQSPGRIKSAAGSGY